MKIGELRIGSYVITAILLISAVNSISLESIALSDKGNDNKLFDGLYTVNVMGEYIDITVANPSLIDISGSITIKEIKTGIVDLIINLTDDKGSMFNKVYYNVPVVIQGYSLPDGKKCMNNFVLDKPIEGMYATIYFLNNNKGILSLTVDHNDRQYHVEGYIKNPLNIKHLNLECYPLSSGAIKGDMVDIGVKKVKPINVNTTCDYEYILPSEDKLLTSETIISKNNVTDEKIITPDGPIIPKIWGLIHYELEMVYGTFPRDQLPGIWKDYSSIDYVTYRYQVNRDQILSDYRYYNTYYYYNEANSRILDAYEWDGHSLGNSEPDCTLMDTFGGQITPTNVIAQWVTYSDMAIKPQGTILLTHACYSYTNGYNPSDTQEMARAWVDYGAKAYVGFTFSPIATFDPFESSFWTNVTVNDRTVSYSEEKASLVQKRFDNPTITLGEYDCLVYGDPNAILY